MEIFHFQACAEESHLEMNYTYYYQGNVLSHKGYIVHNT